MIIPNCKPLQFAWARENNFKVDYKKWIFSIPIEQIKRIKPEIFYISSMFEYYGEFLEEIKKHTKKIFGWISCEIQKGLNLSQFDLILTSLPYYKDFFRNLGVHSELLTASFDNAVLEKFSTDLDKDIDFSFIGSLTSAHSNRIKLVKELIEKTPLLVFGKGVDAIPDKRNFFQRIFKASIYYQRYRGEAWGLDMYKVLRRSKITFNAHIDIAKHFAGNIRMYEATGIGTLLLTDGKHAPNKPFSNDEVVYYDSVQDAVEKVNYFLEHEEERNAIAQKGQFRTISDYSAENTARKMFDYFMYYLGSEK
jgi:spore maturation protein CgeB